MAGYRTGATPEVVEGRGAPCCALWLAVDCAVFVEGWGEGLKAWPAIRRMAASSGWSTR